MKVVQHAEGALEEEHRLPLHDIKEGSRPVLEQLQAMKYLVPDADEHATAQRYFEGLQTEIAATFRSLSHPALGDSLVEDAVVDDPLQAMYDRILRDIRRM